LGIEDGNKKENVKDEQNSSLHNSSFIGSLKFEILFGQRDQFISPF